MIRDCQSFQRFTEASWKGLPKNTLQTVTHPAAFSAHLLLTCASTISILQISPTKRAFKWFRHFSLIVGVLSLRVLSAVSSIISPPIIKASLMHYWFGWTLKFFFPKKCAHGVSEWKSPRVTQQSNLRWEQWAGIGQGLPFGAVGVFGLSAAMTSLKVPSLAQNSCCPE